MTQRMTKKRLSAAVEMIERGMDDLIYDFSHEGFVDIDGDDASVRTSIEDVSRDGLCGVYEESDVWEAVKKLRDAKVALSILSGRLPASRTVAP